MLKVNKVKKIRRIKKKGSSFVLVVFITAILFTTATTMIAVVTNDYKTRVNESKKLENLYQSDAKLDIARNIIVKNADAAVVYANNKVAAKYNDETFNPDGENKKMLDTEFKKYFFEFLGGGTEKLDQGISSKSANKTKMEEIKKDPDSALAYGILTSSIKERVPLAEPEQLLDRNLKEYSVSGGYEFKDGGDNTAPSKTATEGDKRASLQDGELKILNYEVGKNSSGEVDKIVIALESTFYTDTAVSKTSLNNTKTITTKYTINAPDYNQVVGNKQENTIEHTYAVQKAITADGDLNVNSNANLTVNGDTWIKGNTYEKLGADVAYTKYAHGIRLDNSNAVFNGTVSTNNTLSLSNGSDVTVSGELYSYNTYLGALKRESIEKETGNNKLDAGNVFTNNDLVMNSNSSSIKADNYYGISDKKESKDEGKAELARTSSSIIVNKHNSESKIDIKDAAYIPGLAYMDTPGSAYTTGESIGIKDNFEAYTYTEKFSPDEEFGVEEYNLNDLMVGLVESDDSKVKSNHFEQYFRQNGDLTGGGITIGSVYSIGSGVNQGELVNSAINMEEIGEITGVQENARKRYGKNVYAMGYIGEDDTKSELKYYTDAQKNESGMKTVKEEVAFDEINGIDLSKLFKEKVASDGTDGYLLLSADEKSTLTFEEQADGKVSIVLTDKDGNEVQKINDGISKIDSGQVKAVIITKGNVVFKGNVNIKGNLIAGGNVTVTSGANINIDYSQPTINNIIAFNKQGIFDDSSKLFKGKPIDTKSEVVTVETKLKVEAADTGWYDTSKLKDGLWKLKKETGEVIEQK